MKVYLDKEYREFEKEISQYLDHLITFDCNFSGCSFDILYDEFNWVEAPNEYLGSQVMNGMRSTYEFYKYKNDNEENEENEE